MSDYNDLLSRDMHLVTVRHTQAGTHHKSESSLKPYTGYTSKNHRKRMSHTLSNNLLTDSAAEATPLKKTRSIDMVPSN